MNCTFAVSPARSCPGRTTRRRGRRRSCRHTPLRSPNRWWRLRAGSGRRSVRATARLPYPTSAWVSRWLPSFSMNMSNANVLPAVTVDGTRSTVAGRQIRCVTEVDGPGVGVGRRRGRRRDGRRSGRRGRLRLGRSRRRTVARLPVHGRGRGADHEGRDKGDAQGRCNSRAWGARTKHELPPGHEPGRDCALPS